MKRSISQHAAERKVAQAAKRQRQGLNLSYPKMLEKREIRGGLSQPQMNLLTARQQLKESETHTEAFAKQMRSASTRQERQHMETRYQSMLKHEAHLHKVIQNPGNFYWEDQRWKVTGT